MFMKWGKDYIGISAITMCHDGEGNYLLGKRSEKCRDEHNRWDAVGSGGVEFGESIEEALAREVKEECGADIKNFEFLGYREVFRSNKDRRTHHIAFDFRVEIDRNQVVNVEPDKCLEIKWCRLGEFPSPQHTQMPLFLEKYKDKL